MNNYAGIFHKKMYFISYVEFLLYLDEFFFVSLFTVSCLTFSCVVYPKMMNQVYHWKRLYNTTKSLRFSNFIYKKWRKVHAFCSKVQRIICSAHSRYSIVSHTFLRHTFDELSMMLWICFIPRKNLRTQMHSFSLSLVICWLVWLEIRLSHFLLRICSLHLLLFLSSSAGFYCLFMLIILMFST